jgi:GH35 family endo-1,4-beta-xylanase
MHSLLVLFLVCLVVSTFGGRIPVGGDRIQFQRPFSEWQAAGNPEHVGSSRVKVPDQSFRQAVQVVVKARTETPYEIHLSGRIKGQISKGDVLLLSVYARCLDSSDESALGRFTVAAHARHSHRKHIFPFTKTYSVGEAWKHVLIPFPAPHDNAEGYSIQFRLGGVKPQVLELGGLELLNYGKDRMLSDLPSTEIHYEGIEPDAPWRKAAEARIEKHRKANLRIRVEDRHGHGIEGAKVRVELKKHAYGFGVAVGLNSMFSKKNRVDAEKYRAAVEELFNKAVFENRMKWKFYKDNDAQLEEAMEWFSGRSIPLRGHVMVWPAWRRLPRGMEEEWGSRTNEFRGVIEQHIRKMATAYPDTFAEWDVVNELYSQHEFVDMYGKDVVVDWFRIAKEANPNYTSYINDYAILAGYDEKHQQNYYDWIQYLLEQGAPLEGIGLQGHFRAPIPPEEILRRLDRFAEFGLEMQITEYDFEETDELLQARFTRDFMTAVFSHPKTVGIVTWCLWEPAAWKPSAAFFTKDWKKKRIAKAWEHMIKEEWHTDQTVHSNAEGQADVRGFLGDYVITTTHGGRKMMLEYTLKKGGGLIRVGQGGMLP